MSQELLPPPYDDEEAPPPYDVGSTDNLVLQQIQPVKSKMLAYGCLIISGVIANIIIWSIYYRHNS